MVEQQAFLHAVSKLETAFREAMLLPQSESLAALGDVNSGAGRTIYYPCPTMMLVRCGVLPRAWET